ncbi:MAG: peptidase MA family metallohydrolase [Chloroflexota bacterium]|jgi:hypothetical protein|nr:peptidase MA family metallohydrolase [Chloroflexota bacterium]MDH5243689.1 peptidase MA family metallohydrolase [Chloroflexota bacterium]
MTRDLPTAARLHLTIAALAAVIVSGAYVAPVRAADPVFGTPTIDASFESGLTLEQPVMLEQPPQRVELLLTYADASGPLVIEMPPPSSAGRATLRYRSAESDGHVLPNTPVAAKWRITPSQGADAVTGPIVEDVFDDQRFDWQTVSGDVVRVHWYEGDASFGERALRIGEEAIAATADLLGVVEEEPVDFFIYADQAAFYDALGPGTRENVGGQAVAGIRTLFALIRPGEIDDPWVGTVVPHELVHLVFDTAVSNPYHFPPRWLNEGLAVYLSQGYDSSDRRMVDRAAADGTIVPLVGLVGQFPTSAERFFLAYAESVSGVDYLIREHGQEALVALIRSYAGGRTDDEAFSAAIGIDMAGFDAAWLADIGAATPVRYGPQPAPPGPRPADWESASSPASTASPGSVAPVASVAPGAPDEPASDTGGGDDSLPTLILVAAAVFVGAVLFLRRRRAPDRSS